MREYLFRGKTETGEWLKGHLHKIDGIGKGYTAYAIQVQDINTRMCRPHSHEVITETVGQFTGLTDKNGKKIFEGDICNMSILGGDHSLMKIVIKYGYVGFEPLHPDEVHPDDREWRSFWKSEEEYLWDTDYFTVIGNIHDNPELLGEVK